MVLRLTGHWFGSCFIAVRSVLLAWCYLWLKAIWNWIFMNVPVPFIFILVSRVSIGIYIIYIYISRNVYVYFMFIKPIERVSASHENQNHHRDPVLGRSWKLVLTGAGVSVFLSQGPPDMEQQSCPWASRVYRSFLEYTTYITTYIHIYIWYIYML